jgi:two-component system response regulator (stage 0 sporulation protein A)
MEVERGDHIENGASIRIVLVDGSAAYCDVLGSYLNQQAFLEVVGVATNGVKAIEIIKDLRPDVVLLDVLIPQLDGISVLGEFANVEEKPRFIIFTGFGSEEVINRANELGASFFILKPFNHSTLAARIREFSKAWQYQRVVQKAEKYFDLDDEVGKIMRELGVPVHIKGYNYLHESIVCVFDDQSLLGTLSRRLYPKIAKEFNTTPPKVERAIRNAIQLACARGNAEMISNIFRYTAKSRQGYPTNGQFISIIADRLKSAAR